ncbi:MAG: polysaccharide biosynthesis C-terminal domain-containing protein [Bacteroidales bacterium]|nr:polysaccharide biosynthesis C-terminal domain-containing protein [Bacteroidales bacterium]
MFKKIIGTIITRFLVAIFMLVIVVMNARYLGAEKVGIISLIILAITIVQMVNNFIGGAALVYLVPRTPLLKLFIPSYIWGVIASVVCAGVLNITGSIPEGYFLHVMILSLLHSLFTVNTMILLGQERIRAINVLTVAQFTALIATLMAFYLLTSNREVMVYVYAMYVAYIVMFLPSFALITTRLKRSELSGMKQVIREILAFGTWAQTANIFQLFNYRLSYYFIEHMINKAALGVYSTGVQLSEGVWIIPRSISMVQLSRISNEKRWDYAVKVTLVFSKVGVLVSTLIVGLILMLPASFFVFVFGPEFSGIKPVIISLAVGIISLSFSILLSSFFAGMGKPMHSAIASGIGLIFTIALSLWLIPVYGIIGAGIAASCSYTAATIYQLIAFFVLSGVKARDFLIRKEEIKLLIQEVRQGISPEARSQKPE